MNGKWPATGIPEDLGVIAIAFLLLFLCSSADAQTLEKLDDNSIQITAVIDAPEAQCFSNAAFAIWDFRCGSRFTARI